MQTKQGGSDCEKHSWYWEDFLLLFHVEELAEKLIQRFETKRRKQMRYSQKNQLHFKSYSFPSSKQDSTILDQKRIKTNYKTVFSITSLPKSHKTSSTVCILALNVT